MKNRENRKRRE